MNRRRAAPEKERSMMMVSMVVAAALGAGAQAAGPEADVERARLEAHIRDLPALRALWVEPERQEGLHEAERVIERKLRDMGLEPVSQSLEWTTGGSVRVWRDGAWTVVPDPEPRRWRNIYVELPGRVRPEEVIIVGAHFDAREDTPGADDNASGVAGVLELARTLRDRPMERTVRLVFFNLEEVGLIGAREHAAWTRERIDSGAEKVVGMVSVEMIGYFCDEPGCQKSPIPAIPGVFTPPDKGDSIVVVATQASAAFARALGAGMRASEPRMPVFMLDFVPGRGETIPDVRRSDHAEFWDIGAPAVMLTDTSEFRNPNYHKPTDTIETLDLERMTQVVRGLAGAVWRMAGPIDAAPENGAASSP
ncbi:MAG: M20/M25/M40 family metallo-hydrolase [Phycisphaerales bacterium]|nr:M20/M25/M40 family metallo-hydrolase [Phycisphaerales bacterium]